MARRTTARSDAPDEKVAAIILEAEAGLPVREICRRHDISELTFYRWRGRGVVIGEGTLIERMKALEEELKVLRRFLAYQALDVQELRERMSPSQVPTGA